MMALPPAGEVIFKTDKGIDITVYTTRCDTLFGATYMVLSPEHPEVLNLTTPENLEAVKKYQFEASQKSELDRTELATEKTGAFTGAYAINPVNGDKLPIWIADYVLSTYGTGAIMAVPAHDTRDFALHSLSGKFTRLYHSLTDDLTAFTKPFIV